MRTVLALAIALALLAGCAKPEAKYVGKWTGKVALSPASLERIKSEMGPLAANVEEEVAKLVISLDLKAGGNYTLNTNQQGADVLAGTWTLDSEARTITLAKPDFSEETKKQMKTNGMTDEAIKQAAEAIEVQVYKIADGDKSMSMTQSQMGVDTSITFTKN